MTDETKRVAREPTREMYVAANAAYCHLIGLPAGLTVGSYNAIWRAMYDAAQNVMATNNNIASHNNPESATPDDGLADGVIPAHLAVGQQRSPLQELWAWVERAYDPKLIPVGIAKRVRAAIAHIERLRQHPMELRTPRDIVDSLGIQQGSRVAASLRGDKQTQAAAEHWLNLLAADHWHEIISDLSAMHTAPAAAPSDRERRLHEALREEVVSTELDFASRCRLCGCTWPNPKIERHIPGCLAAPLPQEVE
jgi:hypothetical protein